VVLSCLAQKGVAGSACPTSFSAGGIGVGIGLGSPVFVPSAASNRGSMILTCE
jgi:hypothetical protein